MCQQPVIPQIIERHAVLMNGYQRQDKTAALKLAVTGHTLFETRAGSVIQKQLLENHGDTNGPA